MTWLERLAPFVLVITIWQMAAAFRADPGVLPSPLHVLLHSFPELALFGGASDPNPAGAFAVLGLNLTITIIRVVISLGVGSVAGFLLGLSLHCFSAAASGNAFVLTLLRSVPLFALIPLFVFWFPNREVGIFIYITLAVLLVVATNCYEAVNNIPPSFRESATLLGAGRLTILRKVHAPAVLPELRGSMRAVSGLVWAFALGAEYLSSQSGIGFLVYQSYLYSDMGKLVLFGMVYGIMGLLSIKAVDTTIRRVTRWQPTY
ncbi:ABC transporter permease [Longimicrobium sp.]|uniref:ABC transporter permease n=1 Tax=Longimicrobium sp. TaxID=2029185 RepID=UPI002ED7B2FC